jgi:hypothetical protein
VSIIHKINNNIIKKRKTKYCNIHPNIKLDIKGVCWECKRKEIQSVRLSKKPLQKYKPMKGIIITPMGNNIR